MVGLLEKGVELARDNPLFLRFLLCNRDNGQTFCTAVCRQDCRRQSVLAHGGQSKRLKRYSKAEQQEDGFEAVFLTPGAALLIIH